MQNTELIFWRKQADKGCIIKAIRENRDRAITVFGIAAVDKENEGQIYRTLAETMQTNFWWNRRPACASGLSSPEAVRSRRSLDGGRLSCARQSGWKPYCTGQRPVPPGFQLHCSGLEAQELLTFSDKKVLRMLNHVLDNQIQNLGKFSPEVQDAIVKMPRQTNRHVNILKAQALEHMRRVFPK